MDEPVQKHPFVSLPMWRWKTTIQQVHLYIPTVLSCAVKLVVCVAVGPASVAIMGAVE